MKPMPRRTELLRLEWVLAVAATALILAFATAAHANPRPLPFTYQHETLPQGSTEVEQFVDFVPLRALSASGGTDPVWMLGTQFITEFEVGLTDRLELGLYVTYVPRPGEDFASVAQMPEGNGAKQR